MENFIITYAGYIISIISLIFAIIQYRGKKKLEIDKISLQHEFETKKYEKELKYKTFNQYISKVDALNHKLQHNLKSEELFRASSEMTFKIMRDPENSTLAMKEYMDLVNRFIAEWGTEQYRTIEEMSGIKLVCDESLLQLLDEYSIVTKEYVDTTLNFMGKFQFQYPFNSENPELVAFKEKYDKMILLRAKFVNEMRRELGIAKTV